MNTNILKKCIDKLTGMASDDSDINYVLGMLETLYEIEVNKSSGLLAGKSNIPSSPLAIPKIGATETPSPDEAAIMDAKAKAAIAEIKRLETESLNNG